QTLDLHQRSRRKSFPCHTVGKGSKGRRGEHVVVLRGALTTNTSPPEQSPALWLGGMKGGLVMLDRLFHVNICVRDMERSIRFYQQLGFSKVNDFTAEDPGIGEGLGVKANKIRGVFMRLGDDPKASVLDLVQFIDPPTQGQPYATLNNVGICRIAFAVKDIERASADLTNMTFHILAPLNTITMPVRR